MIKCDSRVFANHSKDHNFYIFNCVFRRIILFFLHLRHYTFFTGFCQPLYNSYLPFLSIQANHTTFPFVSQSTTTKPVIVRVGFTPNYRYHGAILMIKCWSILCVIAPSTCISTTNTKCLYRV